MSNLKFYGELLSTSTMLLRAGHSEKAKQLKKIAQEMAVDTFDAPYNGVDVENYENIPGEEVDNERIRAGIALSERLQELVGHLGHIAGFNITPGRANTEYTEKQLTQIGDIAKNIHHAVYNIGPHAI